VCSHISEIHDLVNVIQVTALLYNFMHFLELLFESHAYGTRWTVKASGKFCTCSQNLC